MEPLSIFRILHGPRESFSAILIHREEPYPWQINLTYDCRVKGHPYWEFMGWKGSINTFADDHVELEQDEIYGFLKARFPKEDWKEVIKQEVKKMTLELFE